MFRHLVPLLALLACGPAGSSLSSGPAEAQVAPAAVGKPAPNFTLPDLDGRKVSLSDFAGKTVVLEWFNPGCPFVKYAHAEGPLKDMAGRWTDRGVVWLAINSNAPGKQGSGAALNREAAEGWRMRHPVLLDEDGKVGRAYGAKTTPHMYVVDPKGTLVYAGGLDNAPLGKVEGGGPPRSFVDAALAELAEGKVVQTGSSQPYGCSVKYVD